MMKRIINLMNKKIKIEMGDEELHLIRKALDFYSRVGIGQFKEIVDHPTFVEHLYKECTPKREPVVGDRTNQGEILEIKDGKALISGSVKDGKWCKEHEWKNLKDVKLSTDYSLYHDLRDKAENELIIARNTLYNSQELSRNGNWGIFNDKVDESCVVAYHLVQEIRHKLYLERAKKGEERHYTVDEYPADACRIKGIKTPNFKIEIDGI